MKEMKNKQTNKIPVPKWVLPVLIVAAAWLMYSIYFSPKEGLGAFADFDPNNNANKDIRVKILYEKGINVDQANGASVFFAIDKNKVEYKIQAPLQLPASVTNRTSDIVILRGHIHKEYFHASSVRGD